MSDSAFNATSVTVGDLLNSNQPTRIVVPTFQRGYSWEKKHVSAFWGDISNPSQPKPFFFGPIVIMRQPNNIIELLDGQQRLATATILFSVVRDVARDLKIQAANDFAALLQRDFIIGDEGVRRIEMGETDDAYFFETVQQDPSVKRKASLKSQRHISEAREYFLKELTQKLPTDPLEALQQLKAIRNSVRSDLVMACIAVDSDVNAFQIFETLNDRGLRLSPPDLLLNYLMRVAPDGDRKQIRKSWDSMVTAMGRRDIARFLRHLWVSRYGDLKNIGLFPALRSRIEEKKLNSLEFVLDCGTEGSNYVSLITYSEEHLGGAAQVVRSLVHGLGAQSALPMLLSCYTTFDREEFEKVVRWLIVFVTRWSVFLGLDSASLETLLFEMAKNAREVPADTQARKARLGIIKEKLRKAAPGDDQIDSSVSRLILPVESAEYIIRKLSDAMESKTKEKLTSAESNLEHIYPQNPDEGTWGGDESQSQMEPYTWHLGNLTMLGERLNTKAKNSEYPVKLAKYAQSELIMPRSIAAQYQFWDRPSIEDRANKLAPRLKEVWNFDNPSRV